MKYFGHLELNLAKCDIAEEYADKIDELTIMIIVGK